MATVVLVRHARSKANGSGVLAGRTSGVELDDIGVAQATALVGRLGTLPLADLVISPLQRCQDTVAPLVKARGLRPTIEPRLSEVDYGEWTGRELKDLVSEPLWRVVQQHPSAAVFPGGEGLAAVQARAVAAIREHDTRIVRAYGQNALWVACSHGDVIKAVLADALGLHLDAFQRIVVEPCSLSVVRYTETRPFVLRVNDNGTDLTGVLPPKPREEEKGAKEEPPLSSDAVVGGSPGLQ